ncbi:holin [Leuconostoc pseudomesenteroides]|jgi:formate hydrogenlyase subunit 3/multisubunit Na+/H+ antiporter MnhD subunit|uniref:holin n=1 Tax=Leuconostoc pseudomesenteroides TaxID=33968 RepID=UPI001B8CBBBB|nr:holin [Leuconostoc pseudomesenteroides]MBS0958169.1 holin [Leuconostoc pseudomesenteroides]
MQVNSISDVIIAIALAAIPIIGGWIGKVITGNSKATTLINVLSPLAKAAIVAMQKLGVTQYLEGEAKKSGAVDIVKQALSALGLSDTDEAIIKNAIEKEYAALINELNQTYPQMTAEQAQAQEAAVQQASEVAKADELAKAQQALADAQAKVNALQN